VTTIPFQERKSRLRGVLDLASGCYPRFLFGGNTGKCLPVFHVHESHPASLEPYFNYLADNGYQTVDSDAIAALVLRGVHPGPKSVAICFDDAWASLWVVVAPLLKKYGLRAITYVSPGRVPSLADPRPQWDGQLPFDRPGIDRSEVPFTTWAELRSLHESGLVDVQSHSWRHAMIYCDSRIIDFLKPEQKNHPHHFPLVDTPYGTRFISPLDLGAPIYAMRSRLSDARRWVAPGAFSACTSMVRSRGGADFFSQPGWRDELLTCAGQGGAGRWESTEEQEANILEELVRARELLEAGLRAKPVRHLCFPWAIAGRHAVRLSKVAGYETAFSDRLWGVRAVRQGDPPYQLMRLKHQMIFCLPGKGRSWFFGKTPASAASGLVLNDMTVAEALPQET